MRTIAKIGTGSARLLRAHAKPPTSGREATVRWRRFRRDKPAVQQALLEEQYQLCCYSELRADEEGLGYHIEHVENKSQNPARTFDYGNLAASALDSETGLSKLSALGQTAFGGHAAGKQLACDMAQFVSCHQGDASRYFAYLSDGRVVPAATLDLAEAARASYTITTLNLNSPFLITRRRQWWAELEALVDQHLTDGWSLEHLASVDLTPVAGYLSRFFSLTRQFFGPVAEAALRQNAPALL